MSNKTNDMSIKERLIMVPKSFVAYKKDSVAAIDEAKEEKNYSHR